jgi:hypothetical protein
MPKRILEGVVVSDKGDKTVVVKVERTFLHPVLKKTVRRLEVSRPRRGQCLQGRRQRAHHRVRAEVENQDLGGAAQGRRRPGSVRDQNL